MSIALIVPVYNDLLNAEALCQDFLEITDEGVELLIVDNGSDNPTALNQLKLISPKRIHILRLETNVGFGGGIQEGLKAAQTDWVAWMPGNMKVKPSRLKSFITLLNDSNKLALIKARRNGRRPIARMKTALASLAQSVRTLTPMPDTGGTPTALNRNSRLYKLAFLGPKDYTFESYILFLANRLKVQVIRVPVNYGERLFGNSHWQAGLQSEIVLMGKIFLGIPGWKKIADGDLKGKVR